MGDTGCGVTDEVKGACSSLRRRKKEKARDWAATVYGIIKQSGGDIEIETARVAHDLPDYLPEIDAQALDKVKAWCLRDNETVRWSGRRAFAVLGSAR